MNRKTVLQSLLWMAGVPFCAHAIPVVATPIATATLSGGNYLVTATTRITLGSGDPALIAGGTNLLRVDTAVPSILGTMHDDGLNGDAVAGDGVYTLTFTTTAALGGQMQLQASAAFRSTLLRLRSASGTILLGSVITQLAPNGGQQGQQGESVTVAGQGTHWVQGTVMPGFKGSACTGAPSLYQ